MASYHEKVETYDDFREAQDSGYANHYGVGWPDHVSHRLYRLCSVLSRRDEGFQLEGLVRFM
jgi:hypothetical protein